MALRQLAEAAFFFAFIFTNIKKAAYSGFLI
jgi:hypothetical protein